MHLFISIYFIIFRHPPSVSAFYRLPCGFSFQPRGNLMVANFRSSKTDILIFLASKRLLAETFYNTFIIYAKAMSPWTKKMKEIDFSTLAT